MGKKVKQLKNRAKKQAIKQQEQENKWTLTDQMKVSLVNTHPIVTMIVGALHGLGSFVSLLEANKPAPEVLDMVNRFIGTNLIAIGQDFISKVRNEEAEPTPQIVSHDGSPLGGTN